MQNLSHRCLHQALTILRSIDQACSLMSLSREPQYFPQDRLEVSGFKKEARR